MFRKKIDVDVIKDVLEAVLEAQPHSTFVQSLYRQYQERGALSKRQLEGLYHKALKVPTMAPNKLATLEAVILKKHTKYKSAPPPPKPLYEKDERTGDMIAAILAKAPQHKRVLFFQSKYHNNETLTPAEMLELERFYKLFQK
jgi:Archaea-specific RecJ-like exonuclease, contains DnaJ-type Zn finger domain